MSRLQYRPGSLIAIESARCVVYRVLVGEGITLLRRPFQSFQFSNFPVFRRRERGRDSLGDS